MTPYEIEFLLHCYGKPYPYTVESPVKDSTILEFISKNLIEQQKEDYYVCTEKGVALVKILMAVPMPVQCYINPITKEIIE